jgi:hypothetical protein
MPRFQLPEYSSIMGKEIPKGKLNNNYIETSSQKLTFYDALLTCERGNLEISKGDAPMSVQQAYHELCTDLNGYQVYAELKNRGFHLFEPAKKNLESDIANFDIDKPCGILSRLKRGMIDSLVAFWDYCSYSEIQKKLAIIEQKEPTDRMQKEMIYYDMYMPSSKFKKSQRGPPDFVLQILDSSEKLNYSCLTAHLESVPIQLAVVGEGSINYLSIKKFRGEEFL